MLIKPCVVKSCEKENHKMATVDDIIVLSDIRSTIAVKKLQSIELTNEENLILKHLNNFFDEYLPPPVFLPEEILDLIYSVLKDKT